MGSMDCSVASSVPEERTCPNSTWRMPILPSNGARMVFLAIVARSWATLASACLKRASAASRSATVLWSFLRRLRARSRVCLARVASASAAVSCASSTEVSSLTSTAPLRTAMPESKKISRTVPGNSELTITLCTATSEPMAGCEPCHSVAWTCAVVTASGGGAKDLPALIMAPICIAFTPVSAAATTNNARTTVIQSLRFVVMIGSWVRYAWMSLRAERVPRQGAAGRDERTALRRTCIVRRHVHCDPVRRALASPSGPAPSRWRPDRRRGVLASRRVDRHHRPASLRFGWRRGGGPLGPAEVPTGRPLRPPRGRQGATLGPRRGTRRDSPGAGHRRPSAGAHRPGRERRHSRQRRERRGGGGALHRRDRRAGRQGARQDRLPQPHHGYEGRVRRFRRPPHARAVRGGKSRRRGGGFALARYRVLALAAHRDARLRSRRPQDPRRRRLGGGCRADPSTAAARNGAHPALARLPLATR